MANKKVSKRLASRSLKKKRIIYSTQAAALSVGVHLLLILFAGSIVAIQYVQKRDALLAGENIARPKLERRQLQMPVKAQNLQKKSRRPKVTTRMAAAVQSSFALPDMTGLGDMMSGFDRDASVGDRSLSSMGAAGSLGFGVSGVNFFGAKSKGEKMVFVLGANEEMLTDEKGGFYTYKFAKARIVDMIDGMRSATLFNMMVYTKTETVMFSDKLVPATPENRDAVKKWLDPVNKTDDVVGEIDDMKIAYKPARKYDDAPVQELQHYMAPIQAAMEQKADNIFILCGGYEKHYLSDEEILERFDIDSKEKWLTDQGWPPERIKAVERENDKVEAEARKKLDDENKAREAAGQPKKFLGSGIWSYIHDELGVPKTERPPGLMDKMIHGGYPAEDLIEHMNRVYKFNYVPQRLDKPAVHFVKLISSDGSPVDGSDGGGWDTWKFNELKKLPKAFKGRFELLRGAKTMDDLLRYNDFSE